MQEHETILSSNRELEEKYNYIIEDTNFAKIQKRHSFFIGNVLDGMEDDREYLVSMLQKNTRNHIRKTALIYQYDPLNKVNFHKYIDNHTHIVVLIKLKNGWTCGGYSEGGFIPKHQSDKDGLIFSLTMRKFFELKVRNKKAITYDEFYIIFGNSELRIKSQENKLFSNFGLTSSFYDSKG